MSVFKLPRSIITDINKICANFGRGDKSDTHRMHWLKWQDLCNAKEDGGLNFRDMETFNDALLAKKIWRLLKNSDSMVARVYKAKYYRHDNVLNSSFGYAPSLAWKSI